MTGRRAENLFAGVNLGQEKVMQPINRVAVGSASALIVGLAALFGIVGLTFWISERAQVAFANVIAARDLRGAAVELRNAVQTAESSQRGFLFTGNEIYLAPYTTAKSAAVRHLSALERRQNDPNSAGLGPVLSRLSAIVTEKLGEMDRTIALKRGRRDEEAFTLFRTNRGKTLMDEINIFASGVIRTADERLTAGVTEQRENTRWLRTLSLAGGLLIVTVVGAAGLSIMRYTQALRATRDEVDHLNADLTRRVENRTAELAEANEEIRRFATVVSHDLRAPLVNIVGFTGEIQEGVAAVCAEFARRGLSADDADPGTRIAVSAATVDIPEAIDFIRKSSARMDGLIAAVLKLSREGRRTPAPEALDLTEIVTTAIAGIRHQVSAAGGDVRVVIDAPELVTDRLAIEQVIANLLDNAVKYRSLDRPLRIDVEAHAQSPDHIELTIADNGRGIASSDLERIFDLFTRAGSQDQRGDGIGLAYVRMILRRLGGDIAVTSSLGSGSAFRIRLPQHISP